jgi:hypothetical protein
MGCEPEPAILWLEKPSTLLHPIAVALVVGTIAVLLCLFRFVYRFAVSRRNCPEFGEIVSAIRKKKLA